MDEKNSGSDDMSMLMSINALQYAPPIDGSLVNSRQYKKYNFSPLNYVNSGSPEIVINSGSDYIWGPTSALQLTVKTANAVAMTGAGIFNLINEIEWTHRSGDQLDKTRNANALVAELVKYTEGAEYKGYGGMFGLGQNSVDAAGGKTYILPMSLLLGSWSQKVLIPADMCAGSKMKIQLESLVRAFDNDPGQVDITGVQLLLDSYDLFDGAKKALMAQSANVRTQGLQFSYHSWAQTNKTFTTSAFDLDINLSAAKIITLVAKTRLVDNLAEGKASMVSEPYIYDSWRVRLGSNTNPQHEVKSAAEAYFLTQNAFGNYHKDDLHSFSRVSSGVDFKDYETQNAVVAISLEKNSVVSISGESTNNSRLLNINGEFSDANPRQMDVWVKHLRVCNVMRDNVVVDK